MSTQPAACRNRPRRRLAPEHVRNHFKAELAFTVLVKALNRGVEASETAVRSEMSREKGKAGITAYTIRQVVFTLSPSDGPAQVEAAVKQADGAARAFRQLRQRDRLCQIAARRRRARQAHPRFDASSTTRSSSSSTTTPIGHLTPPSRSGNGIELIAVCNRSASRPTTSQLRKQISDRLLDEHIAEVAARKFRELRATAVISRTRTGDLARRHATAGADARRPLRHRPGDRGEGLGGDARRSPAPIRFSSSTTSSMPAARRPGSASTCRSSATTPEQAASRLRPRRCRCCRSTWRRVDSRPSAIAGKPDAADAPGTIASMVRCVELVAEGAAAADRHPAGLEGDPAPGRLSRIRARRNSWASWRAACFPRGGAPRAVMLLWSPQLAVVPATIHVPLAAVPGLVTQGI